MKKSKKRKNPKQDKPDVTSPEIGVPGDNPPDYTDPPEPTQPQDPIPPVIKSNNRFDPNNPLNYIREPEQTRDNS